MMRSLARLLLVSALLQPCAWAPAVAGPAVNQFETKDLEASPGDLQFQSQNAISFGQPRRGVRETTPGDFAYDDNSVTRARYALEMQMGITSWFRARLGIEFEKERLDDPGSPGQANAFADLQLTGVAVEGVFVVIPPKTHGFGLGLLTEYDAAVRGGPKQFYIGPIVQLLSGPWSATANLLLVQHFGSTDRLNQVPADRKRDFAYAAQVQYELSPTWALAVEGYGTVDRLGNSGTPPPERALFGDFDQHRLGPVVYYRFKPDGGAPVQSPRVGKTKGLSSKAKVDDDDGPSAGASGSDDDDKDKTVSLGVGVLFGLTKATPDQTLKLSLEVNF
jgi:hypothetical protein